MEYQLRCREVENREYSCVECSRTFDSSEELEEHKSHHEPADKNDGNQDLIEEKKIRSSSRIRNKKLRQQIEQSSLDTSEKTESQHKKTKKAVQGKTKKTSAKKQRNGDKENATSTQYFQDEVSSTVNEKESSIQQERLLNYQEEMDKHTNSDRNKTSRTIEPKTTSHWEVTTTDNNLKINFAISGTDNVNVVILTPQKTRKMLKTNRLLNVECRPLSVTCTVCFLKFYDEVSLKNHLKKHNFLSCCCPMCERELENYRKMITV